MLPGAPECSGARFSGATNAPKRSEALQTTRATTTLFLSTSGALEPQLDLLTMLPKHYEGIRPKYCHWIRKARYGRQSMEPQSYNSNAEIGVKIKVLCQQEEIHIIFRSCGGHIMAERNLANSKVMSSGRNKAFNDCCLILPWPTKTRGWVEWCTAI